MIVGAEDIVHEFYRAYALSIAESSSVPALEISEGASIACSAGATVRALRSPERVV